MKRKVSVIICIKNVEKYIEDCLISLSAQTFKDCEVVIIDDGSTDSSEIIIKKFARANDVCIKYLKNKKSHGISSSRNRGLRLCEGEYIFFTDGDCIVTKNWIKEGLKFLENKSCVGVEGKIVYVSEKYKPTFSDHVCKNGYGGEFMTGNIAYKRSAIEKVGGFDERYTYHEDRDIALRIIKLGEIRFNPNMIAYVQQQVITPKDLMARTSFIKNWVYLFKRFGQRRNMFWRIVFPWNLAIMLFPPVLFLAPLFYSFRKLDDFKLLPFRYIYAICERIHLWRECARERVFLI